jgi:hypothetical protein
MQYHVTSTVASLPFRLRPLAYLTCDTSRSGSIIATAVTLVCAFRHRHKQERHIEAALGGFPLSLHSLFVSLSPLSVMPRVPSFTALVAASLSG